MNYDLLPLLKDLSELFEDRMRFHNSRNLHGLSRAKINICLQEQDNDRNYLRRINNALSELLKLQENGKSTISRKINPENRISIVVNCDFQNDENFASDINVNYPDWVTKRQVLEILMKIANGLVDEEMQGESNE